MNIFVTFDYELYFGARTGTVERCITGPTDLLTAVADKTGVKFTHFVDTCFLLRLKSEMQRFASLRKDYDLLTQQMERLWKSGHDLQLHLHPHWEDSYYDGEKWVCITRRYKLSDFPAEEIPAMVQRNKAELANYADASGIKAFRAGGWCVQPFEHIRTALHQEGIKIDSSVFPGGVYSSAHYAYDFRGAPEQGRWTFHSDPMKTASQGDFTEIPISSIYNSPFFYWRLFLLGHLHPYRHKPLGDGVPIAAPGQRRRLLTRWTHNTVSVDGYNARLLSSALRQHERMNKSDMVIIGHPKALSRYGLTALEQFIERTKNKHPFRTFREEK